jgi:hypothetical protein
MPSTNIELHADHHNTLTRTVGAIRHWKCNNEVLSCNQRRSGKYESTHILSVCFTLLIQHVKVHAPYYIATCSISGYTALFYIIT